MITVIYSLSQVLGAELWLLLWAACAVSYLVICCAFRSNRRSDAFKRVLIGLLIAEVAVDLVWALIYYENGVYLNYGIGAVFGLLLWVPALIIAGAIVTIVNKMRVDSL